MKQKKNLIIRITKYGLKNEFFQLEDLRKDLKLNPDEYTFIRQALISRTFNTENPNHIFVVSKSVTLNRAEQTQYYSLLPTAYYNYVDYLEIIEARKASLLAIIFSILALLIGGAQLFYQVNKP